MTRKQKNPINIAQIDTNANANATQMNANADQIAIVNAQATQTPESQEKMTKTHANADQIVCNDANTDQHATPNANAQANATPNANTDQANADQVKFDALMTSLASVKLEDAKPMHTQTPKANASAKSERKTLSSIGVDDHMNESIVLSILLFGRFVKLSDFTKATRQGIVNPVFITIDANDESDFSRLFRMIDAVNGAAKLKLDISMIKADRIAVNGDKCADLDDLLIDSFEHGKDSKLSICIAKPEVSLTVRAYAQFLNFNKVFEIVLDARRKNVAPDLSKFKTFAIGDSTTFKHVSSTVRNLKALTTLNNEIQYYSSKATKQEILLDYAQNNADQITLKAILDLDDDYLDCLPLASSTYPRLQDIKSNIRLILNLCGVAYDQKLGFEKEIEELKSKIENNAKA